VQKLASGAVIAVSELEILLAIYSFIVVRDKLFFTKFVVSMGKGALGAVGAVHTELESLAKLSLFFGLEISVTSFQSDLMSGFIWIIFSGRFAATTIGAGS